MTIDEMINEAWLDSAGRYTVDFGGSNFFRVSNLAASDYANKHPELDPILIPFIAGAIYMKLKDFQKEVLK